MHHTVAWSATTVPNTNVLTDLTPVTDAVIPVTAANHFLPQQDVPLIAIGACGANVTRAAISSPTIALVTTPFIRPLSQALNFGYPQRFWDLSEQPFQLTKLEELVVTIANNAAGATQQNMAVAHLMWQQAQAPVGKIWVLRGTSVSTAVVNTWTQIAMTWNNPLPTGQYAVVGMEAFSATNIATRLILENQVPRPGVFGITSLGNGVSQVFRGSSYVDLSPFGYFHNYNMPLVETLCTSADASFEVYLDVCRVA